MKRILFFITVLIYQFSCAQNAFENSKVIGAKKAEIIEKLSKKLEWQDQENSHIYRSKLDNFTQFLINPFNQNLDPVDVDEIMSILENSIEMTKSDTKGIEEDWDEDIIIKEEVDVDKGFPKGIEDYGSQKTSMTKGVSFTTRLIDGASKFLVNRTKQELGITFYEHFYNKLNKPIHYKIENEGKKDSIAVLLKDIMPNTFLLFDSKQIFETPSFGQTWTSAFQNDLINLPFSFVESFQKDTENRFLNHDLGRYSIILMDGLDKIERGNHPIDIIESLSSNFSEVNKYDSDARIGMLNLISQNCTKEEEDGKQWISMAEFSKLNGDEQKYFTGLIYQQGLKDGVFKQLDKKKKVENIVVNNDNYDVLYQGIKDIQLELVGMVQKMEDAKVANREEADFLKYSEQFVSAINTTYETILKVNKEEYYKSTYFNKYVPISKDILSFYKGMKDISEDGVEEKNYGGYLLSTLNFLNHLSYGENKNFITDVTYYGNFLVDVVFASTHEGVDLQYIINKYALPVTSYRIKKLYSRSIDLNAYPGVYIGYEFSNSDSPNFGVTAPIGFSFSWSKKPKDHKYAPSNSVFISAIDIGAPFSYRFVNDYAGGLPENIKWEQIFSPGIFYVYGFKNSPLVISSGIQYTPLLRKIETQNVLDDENVLRASISLSVDIPIINLYKKPR